MATDLLTTAVMGGISGLIDYLMAHVATCLIPAFFIAGAMNALLRKEAITRYLGEKIPIYKAYPVAVVAGLLLAVCSCTILPLFAGIKKKGAGLGPAVAFLYTAPATNILAIAFTWTVLGGDFALARIILSVSFAVVIGLTLSSLFWETSAEPAAVSPACTCAPSAQGGDTDNQRKVVAFIGTLVILLFVGTLNVFVTYAIGEIPLRFLLIPPLLAVIVWEVKSWFSSEEARIWLEETWSFMKTIFPLLFIGIFAAGAISAILPGNLLESILGTNSVGSNLLAVLFGTFMYFPTLVEVPMARMFLDLGVNRGPLLAYLLADPVISLPSILVVRKYMGNRQTITYIALLVVFCTFGGLIYGSFAAGTM
ncbi:MAG: permease [Methanomicrobiales archaeon]|nr:permease [Methanomicrobiales archaeon]